MDRYEQNNLTVTIVVDDPDISMGGRIVFNQTTLSQRHTDKTIGLLVLGCKIMSSLYSNCYPHKIMLGDQIAELKGKIAGQRVLDVEGPTMETSVSIEGNFRGTQVKQHMTYISKPVSPGIIHGKAKGVMMAGESEIVVSTGEGIGRISPSGVKWRGSAFYRTSSTGKLAFLNNLVGLFETDVDTEGNFTEKIWEWK